MDIPKRDRLPKECVGGRELMSRCEHAFARDNATREECQQFLSDLMNEFDVSGKMGGY